MDLMEHAENQSLTDRLRAAGLRPTRQRLALADLMFGGGHRHLTAEQLHTEARARSVAVSLATVYNTLNQFTRAGLLRELVIAPGSSYFDTNLDAHHHFFFETSGRVMDISLGDLPILNLPPPPPGSVVERVEIIIRLSEPAADQLT
jgi:Fur family iron response transcriptional regulator